jgi:hypothetical protein
MMMGNPDEIGLFLLGVAVLAFIVGLWDGWNE